MAITLDEYKQSCAAGTNRYIVYCENDTGNVFFVRDKAELHESRFTNSLFDALWLCREEAEMLRDTLAILFLDADVEFKILMIHCDYKWDCNVS